MKLSQFKFKLPEEKIALHPTKYRDESRLMVLHKRTGEIEHKMFKDILNYFDDKDVFVFNDTKVFPARLYGNKEKTGARIEVFLLRELNEELRLWDVLVDPARKIRIGNKLYFGDDDSMVAEVIDNTTSRGRTLRFLYDGPHDEFKKALYALGETPLPHTILNRPVEEEDAERFQSIFAKNDLLLIQKIIDPVGGINIQSAHRICHDQHRRTARDLTSQQYFLDISAGKTSDRGLHTRRYDLQFLDQLFRQFSWLFAIHKNPFIVLITSKHDIIRHIHTGNQSHTKAVFRHIRHRDPLF